MRRKPRIVSSGGIQLPQKGLRIAVETPGIARPGAVAHPLASLQERPHLLDEAGAEPSDSRRRQASMGVRPAAGRSSRSATNPSSAACTRRRLRALDPGELGGRFAQPPLGHA